MLQAIDETIITNLYECYKKQGGTLEAFIADIQLILNKNGGK